MTTAMPSSSPSSSSSLSSSPGQGQGRGRGRGLRTRRLFVQSRSKDDVIERFFQWGETTFCNNSPSLQYLIMVRQETKK
jgi:hypothetical protein